MTQPVRQRETLDDAITEIVAKVTETPGEYTKEGAARAAGYYIAEWQKEQSAEDNARMKDERDDYRTRCQGWADTAAQRDLYIKDLETRLGIQPFELSK